MMENKIKHNEEAPAEKQKKKKGLKTPGFRFRVSAEIVDKYLRYVIFLTAIGLVYIWNAHTAQKQIRKLDQLTAEIRELKSDYTTLNSELSYGTRQSVIAQKVDTLGLRKLTSPPYKLVSSNE